MRQEYISKRVCEVPRKVYLFPNWLGNHYQLVVMNMESHYVIFLCSTHSDPSPTLKQIINNGMTTFQRTCFSTFYHPLWHFRNSDFLVASLSFFVSLSHRINTELDTQLNSDSGHSDCVHSIDLSDCDSDSISDSLVSTNSDIMAGEQANHHTLKELGAPDVNYQPLCIQYPDLAANFELKSGLIHLLPKFHGLACPFSAWVLLWVPYHSTDSCPTLHDPAYQDQSVAAVGVFPRRPQYQ
ncbi:hypothetical protein K1719_000424 [Acacia pycnantha]|nr:hypothetical protein K1719_000424 [Acacia pycnantha]